MGDVLAVSVVIPARDAETTLIATLDALATQEAAPPHEVIVVDNGSRDQTVALAEGHPLRPRVLRRERGEGPGAARNEGVAAATANVIAFTDSDCVPTPGWLAGGVATLERSGADIVQGTVLPDPEKKAELFDRTLAVTSEYGLYETANLFVRREWVERVGGFADVIGAGRPFGEDAIMVWRARRNGAKTAFSHTALVHHAVFPGGPSDYLSERAREGLFADLVRYVPELRSVFLYRGLFLNRRAAAFDLAVAGVVVAVPKRSALALGLGLPWARLVAREAAQRAGGRSVIAMGTVACGDVLSFVSRVRGSLRARRVVL